MSDELKPCPFCGSEPAELKGYMSCIVCPECNAYGPGHSDMKTKELAAAWNARADDARIAALESLARDMWAWFDGGTEYCDACALGGRCDEDYGDDCGMRGVFEDRMRSLGIEVA